MTLIDGGEAVSMTSLVVKQESALGRMTDI